MADTMEKKLARQRRGEITEDDLTFYRDLRELQLVAMLHDQDVKHRTIGATLIGYHRYQGAVDSLCHALQSEKALYVRLAIAEALVKIGEPAVKPLCGLLGKIGKNQENKLPEQCCKKPSYPLVRDLAGRILVKIGISSVPSLIEMLHEGQPFQVEQAVDALGAIAYRTGDLSALDSLFQLMDHMGGNPFLLWKITRALGGFRSEKAVQKLLAIYHQSEQPALRWEAIRSIGQIGEFADHILMELEEAGNDPDTRVRDAALQALDHLKRRRLKQ